MRSFGSFQSPVDGIGCAPSSRTWGHASCASRVDAAPVEGDDHPLAGHAVQQAARRALLGRSGPRSVAIGGRAEGLDIQGDAVGSCACSIRPASCAWRPRGLHPRPASWPVVDAAAPRRSGVESRPPLRPTGVFLAVVRRRDRHRRAPGGANVWVSRPSLRIRGQVAHEGARDRVAKTRRTTRTPRVALSTWAVRRAPKNRSSAMTRSCSSHLLRFLCPTWALERASNSSARRRASRTPGGRECCQDRSRGYGLAISTHHHGQSGP